MTQLQFLATLSLVDSVAEQDTWLADFLTGLRYDKSRPSTMPSVCNSLEPFRKSFVIQVLSEGERKTVRVLIAMFCVAAHQV